MVTLWMVVLLAAVSARVSQSARSGAFVTQNVRSRLIGRYAAESGIEAASRGIRARLADLHDIRARAHFLNSLQGSDAGEVKLGEARFAVAYVDANARLDVNLASAGQLASLFSFFVDRNTAASQARAIREWIDAGASQARTIRSLEQLRRIPGIAESLLLSAAPYLTVSGDGRINRVAASDTVIAAAAGSLVDEPARIVIVSRGWAAGQPLTHEIQATYAIDGEALTLVTWQERDL